MKKMNLRVVTAFLIVVVAAAMLLPAGVFAGEPAALTHQAGAPNAAGPGLVKSGGVDVLTAKEYYDKLQSTVVQGQVTDPGGIPVKDVDVVLLDYNTGNSVQYASTAADGTYSMNGIKAGKYTLQFAVYDSSLNLLDTYYGGKYSLPGKALTVKAGKTKTVNMKLKKGGVITGTVKTSQYLVNRAQVSAGIYMPSAKAGQLNTYGYAYTDANGNYTMTGLGPGNYTLYFSALNANIPAGQQQPTSAYYGGGVYPGKLVAVKAGKTKKANQTLSLGATLMGTVQLPANFSYGYVEVMSAKTNAYGLYPLMYSKRIASDGTYSIPDIVGGSYKVQFTVHTLDGAVYRGYYGNTLNYPGKTITINAKKIKTLNFSGFKAVQKVGINYYSAGYSYNAYDMNGTSWDLSLDQTGNNKTYNNYTIQQGKPLKVSIYAFGKAIAPGTYKYYLLVDGKKSGGTRSLTVQKGQTMPSGAYYPYTYSNVNPVAKLSVKVKKDVTLDIKVVFTPAKGAAFKATFYQGWDTKVKPETKIVNYGLKYGKLPAPVLTDPRQVFYGWYYDDYTKPDPVTGYSFTKTYITKNSKVKITEDTIFYADIRYV